MRLLLLAALGLLGCDGSKATECDAAAERCDGVDNDCDGQVDEDATDGFPVFPDADGDGFGGPTSSGPACEVAAGFSASGDDCDDADPDAAPGRDEVCDGVDNDCDGEVDVDPLDPLVGYADADGDGHGDPALSAEGCALPADHVALGDDCDDTDADVHPGADEPDCTDPVDYDCDGTVAWTDADGDGVAGCVDCDDEDASRSPLLEERCDADDVDEDCDGLADDDDDSTAPDGKTSWGEDADGDGYAPDDAPMSAWCDAPAGYAASTGDCDDADAARSPAATEVCGGGDEDCDGLDDDDDPGLDRATRSTFERDGDGDGYGNPDRTVDRCVAPAGWVADATDCDDADAARNPGAVETCDDLDKDEDCDGLADDADDAPASTRAWYADVDGDGFGDESVVTEACSPPAGFVADATDCRDADAAVSPDGTEVCDAADLDEDCDGLTDDADADVDATTFTTWHVDADGDGYGDPDLAEAGCEADGRVLDDTDCDDGDASVSPSGVESCATEADDDCDGTTDAVGASSCTTWWYDGDGDGYGTSTSTVCRCEGAAGFDVAAGGVEDCDEADATVFPGAEEVCDDGVDGDCDAVVDEDCVFPYSGEYALEGTSTDADAVLRGMRTDDYFGEYLGVGADFDGDGLESTVVVAPGAYYRYSWQACAAYVYDGFPTADGNAESVDVAIIYGSTCTEYFEQAWPIPDFDSDGRDELALSVHWGIQQDLYFFEGEDLTTTISYLSSSRVYDSLIDIPGPVVGAGDFDDPSGNDDVAIGDSGGSNRGVVYLYEYGSSGLSRTATSTGTTNADGYGAGVAGGPGNDANGDGYDDLFVGAPGVDTAGSGAGAAYVVEGPGLASASSASVKIDGATAGDALGTRMGAPGDVDGDGKPDLLATAPYNDDAGADAGAVYVFVHVDPDLSGQDDEAADSTVTILGAAAGDSVGANLVATGDVNADGEVDLLLGSEAWESSSSAGDAGAAWFLYGPLSGTYDLASDYDARFVGDETGDYCGVAVGLADLDGDGGDDLIVGCTAGDQPSATDVGTVYFFPGYR